MVLVLLVNNCRRYEGLEDDDPSKLPVLFDKVDDTVPFSPSLLIGLADVGPECGDTACFCFVLWYKLA